MSSSLRLWKINDSRERNQTQSIIQLAMSFLGHLPLAPGISITELCTRHGQDTQSYKRRPLLLVWGAAKEAPTSYRAWRRTPEIFFVGHLHSSSPWPPGNPIAEVVARQTSEIHGEKTSILWPEELWSQKCRQNPLAFVSLFPLLVWPQIQVLLWQVCGRAGKQSRDFLDRRKGKGS